MADLSNRVNEPRALAGSVDGGCSDGRQAEEQVMVLKKALI